MEMIKHFMAPGVRHAGVGPHDLRMTLSDAPNTLIFYEAYL